MFNLNIKRVNEAITIKADGSRIIEYGFRFNDDSYGYLFTDGEVRFTRTIQ